MTEPTKQCELCQNEQLDRIEFMLKTNGFIIGKYELYHDATGLCIYCDDGEGGSFDIKKFEQVVDQFYSDNF